MILLGFSKSSVSPLVPILFLVEVFYHSFWITWTTESWLWLDPYSKEDTQGYFRVSEMFARFWQGGPGPGGYYIGFLLQLVFLFGILYWMAKKAPRVFGAIVLLLVCIGCIWEFPLWNGYQWIVSTVTHLRPLGQEHILIVLLGIAFYQNRDLLFVWGFIPVWIIAAAINKIYPDAADLFWAWGALWFALECSRLRLPAVMAAIVGHLGKASYFIYLMQKAYCATAISRWLMLKWNLYDAWNVGLCLLLGFVFYGAYSMAQWMIENAWKRIKEWKTECDSRNAESRAGVSVR